MASEQRLQENGSTLVPLSFDLMAENNNKEIYLYV